MARIPDTEIQRLKDEVAVQRLIESAGIMLKKTGKEWRITAIRNMLPAAPAPSK